MAVVKVLCLSCGVKTTFTDGVPDNDMITKTDSTYKCNSCGLKSSDFPLSFKEES